MSDKFLLQSLYRSDQSDHLSRGEDEHLSIFIWIFFVFFSRNLGMDSPKMLNLKIGLFFVDWFSTCLRQAGPSQVDT